ncbi:MAG: CRISPR-associated endonuclease Cas2 [Thermoprotei archaeon]|nr:MAG: CRISPR-associated endonuclease Cas2 [Thermoprotei archaeon]
MRWVLVIYDITDDELRQKVADTLHRYGLARVQKSAFLGKLPSARLRDLATKLQELIRGKRANIQIYKLCKHCYSTKIVMGVPTVNPLEYEKAMKITTLIEV